MNPVLEILSGIFRFLPNTMTASLLVLGVFLGKVSWIAISVGAIALTMFVMLIQSLAMPAWAHELSWLKSISGGAAILACSSIPTRVRVDENPIMYTTPSLWMALTAFYFTFIIKNATNVYSQAPALNTNDKYLKFKVDHRKSVGLVSMVATGILLSALIITRFFSTCESVVGSILGLLLGIGAGIGLWYIMSIQGSEVYPDIHGVMIGLKPGSPYSNENYYS